MKTFMKIMLYLSFLWLVLVYLFVISVKKPIGYIQFDFILLLLLISSFLIFFFFLRKNNKSYKILAISLFLLPCITIIVNCIPQEREMGLDDFYDEKTLVTVYPILKQGIDFYFLNVVVFLIGLVVYLYQAYLQSDKK